VARGKIVGDKEGRRDYEINEINEINGKFRNGISFISFISFISYSLFLFFIPFNQSSGTHASSPNCLPHRPVPIDRWRGDYFNNLDLSGAPVMVRDDGMRDLDFDWGLDSPAKECNLNVDRFSVRWTRTIAFSGGAYRFTLTSDDGVRVFIDGQERFNRWESHPLTTETFDLTITPGNHLVVIEYFENYGSAVLKFDWKQHPCNTPVAADHWKGEYFANDNLSSKPLMTRDDGDRFIHFDWGEKGPSSICDVPENTFAARWSRRVAFAEGAYRFEVQTDGGARVYIDGQLRFDQWGSSAKIETYFDLPLQAGNHQVVFEYRDAGRKTALASLGWKSLPCVDTVDPAHWRGEYFNSDNLSGQAIMVRDDGASDRGLEFNWDQRSPSQGCNVRPDNFSVRWTGSPIFTGGVHRFTVTANGGLRLLIDGQIKIDRMVAGSQKQTFDLELAAGAHQISLEYADFGEKAAVKLTWQPPPCIAAVPADHWRGEYFNNKTLSGKPFSVRDDGTRMIDFDWELNPPIRNCSPQSDGFSTRWTRTVNFAPGMYRFIATADDGVRLSIDGKKIIDQWNDQSRKTYSADIELPGGLHRIVFEFYENSGSAVAKLLWINTPCSATVAADRWKGEYFNNTDLSGKPALVRDDGNEYPNFDWGLRGPDSSCGVNIDNFSARWTRTVTFGDGVYRFTVSADDGVRVYIDGELKFERWIDQATTHTFELQLSAGNHVITLEYFERWGSAFVKLNWEQHPCFASVPSDHWRGEYFNGTNLSGRPVMITDHGEGFLEADWGTSSPKPDCQIAADQFSVRWTRKIILPAGIYQFKVTADDGVRVFVNGNKLIDQWQNQRPATYTANLYLPAGNHQIVVEYYEQTGGALINLSWEQPGGNNER
jgi:PA14 domain